MNKLLHAGLRRYFHSIIFWICLIASLLLGIFIATADKSYGSFENTYVIAELLIYAVLISVSIGKEYSDGGFRNKIIAGHTKGEIYLSEWLISVSISLCLFIVCSVPFAVINSKEIFAEIATNYIIKIGVGMLLANVASMVISIVISMLISNKVIAPIINIFLILCLLVVSGQINGKLAQPKYEYLYEYNQETGEYDEYLSDEINSRYVGEPLRTVLQLSVSLSPEGQITEYEDILYLLNAYPNYDEESGELSPAKCDVEDEKALNTFPLYSACLIVLVTSAGYLLFRKKELR